MALAAGFEAFEFPMATVANTGSLIGFPLAHKGLVACLPGFFFGDQIRGCGTNLSCIWPALGLSPEPMSPTDSVEDGGERLTRLPSEALDTAVQSNPGVAGSLATCPQSKAGTAMEGGHTRLYHRGFSGGVPIGLREDDSRNYRASCEAPQPSGSELRCHSPRSNFARV